MEKGKIVKKLMAQSAMKLLRNNKPEDITVNDIIADCGMSRTTFYRYFSDKYALINWVYAHYMEELINRYQHSACYKQLMYDLTTFLSYKRELYLSILSYSGQNSFIDDLRERTTQYVADTLKSIKKVDKLSATDTYLVKFNSSGVVNIIYDWLRSGCRETPKEISQILLDAIPRDIGDYFSPYYHNDWEFDMLPDQWEFVHTPNELETL